MVLLQVQPAVVIQSGQRNMDPLHEGAKLLREKEEEEEERPLSFTGALQQHGGTAHLSNVLFLF